MIGEIQVPGDEMNFALCAAIGYLIGNVNPAYIFGRLRGFDIRGRGSGNAGATNVTLVMGKITGLLCALLDIFKSYAAYKLARLLFPMLSFAGILASVCCILGHIFPFWMNFNGGKGLASMGGMILAYDWRLFLMLLTAEVALALIVNYICVMPLSVCLLFPVIYGMQTNDWAGILLLMLLIPVVFYKHMPNLRRIVSGREARLSWLWNAQAEEARLKERFSDDEWNRIYRKADQK